MIIGQWAPVVGTGLAILGSLYLLLAAEMAAEEKTQDNLTQGPAHPCPTCGGDDMYRSRSVSTSSQSTSRGSGEMEEVVIYPSFPTIREMTTLSGESDPGGRRIAARFFNAASSYLATKAHNNFEKTGFERNQRTTFPEVPAENFRNENYNDMKNIFENTPSRSRTTSFVGSDYSNGEGGSRTPREAPNRQLSLPVRSPRPAFLRRPHSNTLPSRSNSFETPSFIDSRDLYTSSPTSLGRDSQDHHQSAPSISESPPTTPPPGTPAPPTIVVSSDTSD